MYAKVITAIMAVTAKIRISNGISETFTEASLVSKACLKRQLILFLYSEMFTIQHPIERFTYYLFKILSNIGHLEAVHFPKPIFKAQLSYLGLGVVGPDDLLVKPLGLPSILFPREINPYVQILYPCNSTTQGLASPHKDTP